jgi:hypothetical protein
MFICTIIFNRVTLIKYFRFITPKAEALFILMFLICNGTPSSGPFRLLNWGPRIPSWAWSVGGALGQDLKTHVKAAD